MLAGGAPRIILLSLDRQTPFSRRPSIHQGGICPTVFPSPSLLNCAGSLTCSFSVPSPPSACSLGAAFARGRSDKVTRNGCGFEDLLLPCSDLLPGTCHVLYCHMVQQPVFSRTVCSNTGSSSWDVALVTRGFFPLPLQLSPRQDAACSAGSS